MENTEKLNQIAVGISTFQGLLDALNIAQDILKNGVVSDQEAVIAGISNGVSDVLTPVNDAITTALTKVSQVKPVETKL